MSFAVTVYTSKKPLGKMIDLDAEGHLRKRPMYLAHGEARIERFDDLAAFASRRAALSASQAFGYGVCSCEVAEVTTKSRLAASGGKHLVDGPPVVARDNKHFSWATGNPGVLMLDYDPPKGQPALSAGELVSALRQAVPQLNTVPMLWTPSSGSNIWRGDVEIVGVRGAHVYLAVTDASRIPQVGSLIFDRLALAGYGHIKITGAGTMLNSGLIDAQVWQPERLDYVHASCSGELEQRLAEHCLFDAMDQSPGSGSGMLDANLLPTLTEAEQRELKGIWLRLQADASIEAKEVFQAWARCRALDDLGADAAEHQIQERAKQHQGAARNKQLLPEHRLRLSDGRTVTVQDLKDRPQDFEGVAMADPHEPEYGDGDKRIAIAFLHADGDGEPIIFSHAHGGITYRLHTAEDDLAGVEGDGELQPKVQCAVPQPPYVIDPQDFMVTARLIRDTRFNPPAGGNLVRWNGGWFRHAGPRYDEVTDETIINEIWRFLDQCKSRNKSGELIKFKPSPSSVSGVAQALGAELQQQILQVPQWLNTATCTYLPSDLVSLSNGLLHLPTRMLLPHSADFFNRNALPFAYDPESQCPNWHQFLESVWPNDRETQQSLQEYMGYLISGDTSQHRMLLIIGRSRSGKGTIASVMTALLGAANVAAPALADLTTQFGLQSLIGKIVAIVPDARDVQFQHNQKVVEKLLGVSANDMITVDRKNKEPWVGQLGCRIVIMSNELPRLVEASGALMNRIILLPMKESFWGREDFTLQERLAAELPGIFNWALEGMAKMRERGRLIQPASGLAEIESLRRLGNPVMSFVTDRCDIGPTLTVSKDVLFGQWKSWCLQEGNQPGGKELFIKRLLAGCPNVESARVRLGDGRQQTLTGIGLQAWVDDDPFSDATVDPMGALQLAVPCGSAEAAALH